MCNYMCMYTPRYDKSWQPNHEPPCGKKTSAPVTLIKQETERKEKAERITKGSPLTQENADAEEKRPLTANKHALWSKKTFNLGARSTKSVKLLIIWLAL